MLDFNKDTPVLFLVFNRPTLTSEVFKKIKAAAPKYLYVAADGPRNDLEKEKCTEVRAIFDHIDWDCELKTLFRDTNLGCGKAVSEGIKWFFDQEEQGIVLEDDCLPDESFFGFCSTMLDYYKDDERVGHIGGANFQQGIRRGNGDYYFSEWTHVWGWASWRRVWKDYDFTISSFAEFDQRFEAFPGYHQFAEKWTQIFTDISLGKIDTWDYQYVYLNLTKGYKSIIPNINLVANIGMGVDSTHTAADNPFANELVGSMDKIEHPLFFIPDVQADIYTNTRTFEGARVKKKNIFSVCWKRIKTKLRR